MSTHIEFAHMCSNNFCPVNLNYVTEMLYLLTLSIINTFYFFLEGGVIGRKNQIFFQRSFFTK